MAEVGDMSKLEAENSRLRAETERLKADLAQARKNEHDTEESGRAMLFMLEDLEKSREETERLNEELNGEIVQRKRAEQETSQLNAELEERVTSRTAELEVANKELEAVNRELEGFAYAVSHDLRAPLRGIDGFSQALVEEIGPALGDEGKRIVGILRSSAQQMGHLIDDLLSFSRMARRDISVGTVDMAALAATVKDELANAQGGPGASAIVIGGLPAVAGDRAMLKQVFVNLLSNAVKYSRNRERPLIEVTGRTEGGECVYCVRDNGIGFDMAYAQKLFGVFQRLHSSDEYEGTGVGLALAQRIINRHGGRIWAEAAVDAGATFCFALPEKGQTQQ